MIKFPALSLSVVCMPAGRLITRQCMPVIFCIVITRLFISGSLPEVEMVESDGYLNRLMIFR